MATQTFHPFPLLPPELRLMIFTHALNPLSLPPHSFKLDSACLSTIHCLRFECLSGLEEAILGPGPGDGAAIEVTSEATTGETLGKTLWRRACESYNEALMRWIYTRCHWTETACGHRSDEGETVRCQRALMGTCRVARGVVLESWIREVEDIEVQEVVGEGGERWRRDAVKLEVLEVLGRLIGAL